MLLNFKNKYYNLDGMNFYIKILKLGWALYTYIYIIGGPILNVLRLFIGGFHCGARKFIWAQKGQN